jgi:hypothetical protein
MVVGYETHIFPIRKKRSSVDSEASGMDVDWCDAG